MQDKFSRDLDWNLLKVFNEIARAGGVTHAARKLSRKQPALSLALKRLETRLGVTLCRRGPAGFQLTEEGQRVAEICTALSRYVGDIPDRIAAPELPVAGRLRLRLVSDYASPLLDDAIAAFHGAHPQVELAIEPTTWESVGRALLRGDTDIGVAPARLPDAELQYEFLGREVYRPYCGRPHALFGKILQQPAALAETPFILPATDEAEPIVKFRLRHNIGRLTGALCDSLEEARRLAVLGVGLCFLPEGLVERDVADGRLWPVLLPAEEPAVDIFIITNPKAGPSPARQRFLEELRKRLPAASEPMRMPRTRPAPAQRLKSSRGRAR
jgi:LysR family transcriptional regulator, transcriptional activator for bauABCD operon